MINAPLTPDLTHSCCRVKLLQQMAEL
jgi:hypothetical protein